MRLAPDLSLERLIACLHAHYGLHVASVRFLPIGYDPNSSVYEATTTAGVPYFVKLRTGDINPAHLRVPHLLAEHGVPNIVAPLATTTGQLCCFLEGEPCRGYTVIVYPFIRGENAMVAGLSDRQWREFGATLNALHRGGFAALLRGQVPAETFALPCAQSVHLSADRVRTATFDSPATKELASFWNENASLIEEILARAEEIGKQLRSRSFEYVLCHADIHAANILVGEEGGIYLVDWDGPLIAPRERDLLFVVGSPIARTVTPAEEALFFQGYGAWDVDLTALAYYRYERALEDMGVIGQQIFFESDLQEEAKADEVALFRSLFDVGNIVEAAQTADLQQQR